MPRKPSKAAKTKAPSKANTPAVPLDVAVEPKGPFTIATARRYLDSLVNLERRHPAHIGADELKLDRMRRLLDALDNPEASVRCVHVAGSKGKGSVCEMLAAALQGCGYTTGLYTSPHLIDVRERIRLAGKPISKRDFASLIERAATAASTLPSATGEPSYFEALTAAALLAFAEKPVDIAVIEVGLGGRLDSTNLVHPDATIITHLQLEHTDILGATLPEIAAEKAGIFKPGIPAITLPQEPEAMRALVERAHAVGCELRVLGETVEGATTLDFTARFESDNEHGPHSRVSLVTNRVRYEHIPVPLVGTHQAHNAGLALAALDALAAAPDTPLACPEIDVVEGLARTPRDGRLDTLHTHPTIIADGAHTPRSIAALVEAIGATTTFDSMAVVFACNADKNIDEMLAEIGRGADKIIFTRASTTPRAADPTTLAERYLHTTGKDAQTEPTIKDAINTAARAVGRDDIILVTGSFYAAGEAKKLLQDKRKGRDATKPNAAH